MDAMICYKSVGLGAASRREFQMTPDSSAIAENPPEFEPFEFTVLGPPVSAQAKRKDTREKWKQRVRRAAEASWPDGRRRFPSEDLLTFEVTYFCNDLDSIDVDNIPKPISDALIKLVYDDDKKIIDCIARKRALADDLVIDNPSQILLAELERDRPFLLVTVRRNIHPKLVP